MAEEASLGFRLRNIDQRRNYLLDEIKHNDLKSKKYKKTCKYLSCVEKLLILSSIIAGCLSISAFASLVCILVGITSSFAGIKFFAIIAGIKKYKSIIKKKKKKHDEIVLLGKYKLNTVKVLVVRL